MIKIAKTKNILSFTQSKDNTEEYLNTIQSQSRTILQDNNSGNKFD